MSVAKRSSMLLLCISVACSPASPSPVAATPEPRAKVEKAIPPAPPDDTKDERSEFTSGCETDWKGPHPEHTVLTRDLKERWLWACRAQAVVGAPKLRDSGYPDFKVKDGVSGVCMTLSIEDVGAFIYHAPEGRAEALRTALEAQSTPADCSFEVALPEGLSPRRGGLRGGVPFDEPLYDVTTFAGALAFFRAKPSENTAYMLISGYLELEPKSRPADVGDDLDRALTIELDQFDKMEVSWLSQIGKDGYCDRLKQHAKLPLSKANSRRVAAERKRFCTR